MRQGKRAEAAELNSQILKDDPNDNDARGLAATFMLDKGDVTKALTELQAVVTHSPENPVAQYNLGRAHAARGEWEQARQRFQKAIDLRPDYVLARLALAQLQVTQRTSTPP
jgi:tetratricopeptide (TPR) repeat protein